MWQIKWKTTDPKVNSGPDKQAQKMNMDKFIEGSKYGEHLLLMAKRKYP